jgi:hypothetical protein
VEEEVATAGREEGMGEVEEESHLDRLGLRLDRQSVHLGLQEFLESARIR